MKKIIAVIILLFVAFIGVIGYQVNEKNTQQELYDEAAIFFQEEDYKKAIQFLGEASEHNNLFSGKVRKDIAYYQAEAYMKLEEYDEAIVLYDGLIEEAPKDEIAYMMKAYCFSASGRMEEGAVVYEHAYEKTKKEEFLYYLANQYVTMKEYEKALEVVHNANVTEAETEKQLEFLEIVIYEKQQDYKTAYEKAEKFCKKYPDDEQGMKEKEFLKKHTLYMASCCTLTTP